MSIRIDNIKSAHIKEVIEELKKQKTYKCLDKLNPSQLRFLGYVTLKTLKAVTSTNEDKKDLTIKQKDFYKHIVDIANCIIEPSVKFKSTKTIK